MKEQAKDEERPINEVTALRQQIAELEAAETERQRAAVATQQRGQELETLSSIAAILAGTGSFEEKINRVLEELARIVPADWVTLRLPNRSEAGLHLVAAAGAAALESPPMSLLPYGESLPGTAYQEGRVIIVNDLEAYPHPSPALVAQGMKSGVIMPIKVGDLNLGVVNVVSREVNHFTPERVTLVTTIGDGLGVLLENVRLLEELRLRSHELESLSNIAAILAQEGSFEEKATQVLEELATIAQADLATLRVPDEKEQGLYLMAAAGPADWERPPVLSFERGVTSVAFRQGALVVANDYAAHPRAEPSAVAQGTRSSVFLPIKAIGHTFGVIDVLSKEVDHFTPERVRLLTAIVDGVGVLLENARVNAEAQRLARENAAVAEIGRIIGSSLHIDQVYENFATEMKRLVHFDRTVIQVIEPGANTYPLTFMSGVPFYRNRVGDSLPLAGSQLEHILATGRTLVREDFLGDLGFARDEDMLMVGLCSSIGVPLVSKGKVFGALILASRRVGAYGPRERSILERLANQIAPAVANAQLYEQRLRAQELETLFTIANILALPGNFSVKCRGVLEELARVVQAHLVVLRMPDAEQQGLRTVSTSGEDIGRVPLMPLLLSGQTISSLAFEQGESVVANDYPSHTRATPQVVAGGIKSVAALPIKSGGRTLAVVTLTSQEPDHFNSDRMRLLTAIANGLGGLLENAGLREEARQQAMEIEVISEVARIITSTLTIDQVYEQFAAEVKKLVHFDRVNINVIDPPSGRFTIRYLSGQEVPGRQVGAVLPLAGTLTGQATATGTTVIREDIAAGPPRPGDAEYLQVGLQSSITVPLVSKGRHIGSLTLRSKRVGAFARREQDILEGLAAQIAPAVENSLLYGELQASIQEKAVVDEVARIITSTLNIDQVYEQFAAQMKKLMDFERATVNVIDRETNTYQVKYLFGPGIHPGLRAGAVVPLVEGSCTHYVDTTNRTLNRADIAASQMFPDDADFVKAGMRSLIGIPLVSKERVIGCLILCGRGVGAYGPREQRILEGLAAQIAPAVENSLLYEDLQARIQEKAVVDEVARIVTSTLDLDQVYEQFAVELKKLVDFDRTSINHIDHQAGVFVVGYEAGISYPGRRQGDVVPLQGTVTQRVMETRQTVLQNYAGDRTFAGELERFQGGLRSGMTVPLVSKDRVIGSLNVSSRQAAAFGKREQLILEGLAAQIAPAVENSLLYEDLRARTEEKAVVDEVARIITSTLDLDQAYEQFAVQMKKLVDFQRAVISVIDRENNTYLIKYHSGLLQPGQPVGVIRRLEEGSNTHYVAKTKKTLNRADVAAAPMFPDDADFAKAGLCSQIVVPLLSKETVIGCLILRGKGVGAYGPREQRILEGLAAQIAPAVENSLLYEDLRARTEEKAVVDEVARIITSTLTVDQVYERFAAELKRLVDFERASVSVIGQDKTTLSVQYLSGLNSAGNRIGEVRPLREGTHTHYVMTTGQTLVRPDIATNLPFHEDDDTAFLQAGLRSTIAVPLISKGAVIGSLILRARPVGAYGPREQRILEGLAAQVAPAVENSLLFEGAQRAALALESAGDAVVFLDPKGRVQFINRAAEEMSGYTATEVQGKSILLIARAGSAVRARGKEMLWQAVQGGWRGETRVVRKDGEELTLNLAMAPVTDHQDSVVGIVGVAQDITERKRMEERMQETSRLISLGELAAGVAHEINNPLTAVAGFSQLLMAEDLPKRVREDLAKINAEGQRAARMVQNLLSLARKHEPEKRYLDVTTVLERALALKEHDLRVDNIQVTCHWARDLPCTMVDEHQLLQAVLNILTNAHQAILLRKDGGGQLVLRAMHLRDRRATRPRDRIRISISDDGPGILPEHLPRIFDPFFTTKEVGKGTGLGLSIAYAVVQQHGGDLWAESAPGKGATFHLELPIIDAPDQPEPPATTMTKASTRTQRLLVVDDEPGIRDLLAKALATKGYEVDLAENGEEAWRKVQGRAYGCILLDLKMPGMSGQQLYHRIAESDQGLARRVIFMTGDTASPDTRDFLAASGNPIVNKPFNLAELHQQILHSLEATSVSQ